MSSYIRTKETREKQSLAMRERAKTMDFKANYEKARKTIAENGIVLGRKLFKEPEDRICPICGEGYHVRTLAEHSKKYCSATCYNLSKKGKRPRSFTTELLKNMDRSYMYTEEYRLKMSKPDRPLYKKYRSRVNKLTEKNYLLHVDKINPSQLPRTIAGVDNGYQLDHIKPVRECFDLGVSIEEASSPENLRMLPWIENLRRNRKL